MNTSKKTATVVGVLFILGFVGIASVAFTGPILGDPDYLVQVSANENQMLLGALFEIIMAVACAGIAIGLYPVLKKHNEALALGAVSFRIIEAILFFVVTISLLSLLTLSQEYVRAGASDAPYFQTLGALLLAVRDWAGQVLGVIAFSLGALMYYAVFYQSKLIPRWLSGWGLFAAALHLAAGLLTMFGFISPTMSTLSAFLALPIGLQEMVLAVWLIVKGFNPSALASSSARTDMGEIKVSRSIV